MPDENDRIKSALEIALEKAEKLGSLSAEEKQHRKDEEYLAAAEALAMRYLEGLPLTDIDLELAKYQEEERSIVVNHLVVYLVNKVGINQDTVNERILAAIAHILPESKIPQSIAETLHDYRTAKDRARQENLGRLEADKRSELEQIGISGSAVQPAIETSSEWIRIQQDLDSHYEQRLDEIKRNLPIR